MRSCDHGAAWEELTSPVLSPTTSDPYLWVDPVTDRVFDVQMLQTQCVWIAWSDDDGASWAANPLDCGLIPDVDHMKLSTGPWTSAGYGMASAITTNIYETAVYLCHNSREGVLCYTSFDGGMTFPVGGTGIGPATSGGLHGAITTAPDGTIYVPPRLATPTVAVSKDNGFTWTTTQLGKDAGTPSPRKNSEVAADSASNAYYTWIGEDQGVYISRSIDSGVTWDAASIRISPPEVTSSTFPQIGAGDPGRIAVAYLGSENEGANAHEANATARYDMYVTFSLDALSEIPTWRTVKVTTDSVQIGSICLLSSDCSDGNRNLLDFNDLSIDKDGRIYIAYSDGCTAKCSDNPDAEPSDSRDAAGMVAILQTGPSLYAAQGTLAAPTA